MRRISPAFFEKKNVGEFTADEAWEEGISSRHLRALLRPTVLGGWGREAPDAFRVVAGLGVSTDVGLVGG
jgi:hypothetical protein